ncbi:MAG: transcriptional regulator NrdR [Acidiferrobacterales bacterium]|nr:transcriptional regulator NrdR [Acidiferrobacterales bacterium]
MRCPYCASEDTRVIDSRLGDGGESVRRRRECVGCEERFTTSEHIVLQLPQVIKSSGLRERFDEEKLRRGLARALEKRPVDVESVEGAVNRIMRQFTHKGEREIPAKRIGEAVMDELRMMDEVAYVRFASVYRSFQDLEEFSDEVEKLRDSLTDRTGKVQLSLFAGGKE